MDLKNANTVSYWGIIPQMTMILSYVAGTIIYETKAGWWSWIRIIDIAGCAVFIYCLYILYVLRGRTAGLITTGPFKYTRHPMYTGLFLMNLIYWIPEPASSDFLFYALQALFLITLVIAGWFQEKETLVRFGTGAEDYYQKTPRLFFMYPFRNTAA